MEKPYLNAVDKILEQLQEVIRQVKLQPDRNLLFLNLKNSVPAHAVLDRGVKVNGTLMPVTRSFPEDFNLVRFRLTGMDFEHPDVTRNQIITFFEQYKVTVLHVQFDQYNGFYSDTTSIYIDIKSNPTILKKISRFVKTNTLGFMLHWECAPSICTHCRSTFQPHTISSCLTLMLQQGEKSKPQ